MPTNSLGGSPYYYCRRRALPGYGDTGWITSKSRKKKVARDMERLLEELAERALLEPSWYDLLDAICRSRTVPLPDALRAKRSGTLSALRKSLKDPPLDEVIEQFLRADQSRQVETGINQLRAVVPPNCRISYLTDGGRITKLCVKAETRPDGKKRKRNSVIRYMLRATSKLVTFHYGRAERNRIWEEVDYSRENDTRKNYLTTADIKRLLQACEALDLHELGVAIRLAMQTSADRGELFAGDTTDGFRDGLRAHQVKIFDKGGRLTGEVYLNGTKTEDRARTAVIPDPLCREILALAQHKDPDEQVFSISYSQLDNLWQRVRKKAKLPRLRFKDLRRQYAIYGEEAGIPQTVLSRSMGHDSEEMTRRYQERVTLITTDQAESLYAAMFDAGENDLVRKAVNGEP